MPLELSATEAWAQLLEQARHRLPEATLRTWLEPVEPIHIEDGQILLSAPDQFAVEWNESKHGKLLAEIASATFGQPMTVAFQVQAERKERPQMDFFVAPAEDPAASASTGNGRPMTPLNHRYTFKTFVIGKSNELAAAAAHAAAEAPGKSYNPLFIYGATGLGKTHLMQAIAHALVEKNPSARVIYLGAEQFINEVIQSIRGRTMPEFRKRYRSESDIFLVDDVHFLEGKEMTQEEFFHTFNALHEAGKQIVVTSDRPPNEIPGLESRLVSRFEWGMVADIGQPDLEHRIAILRKKAEQEHLELTIPDDVLRFIAEHVRSSVRELEGCIIKLLLYASLRHREITVDLAREALSDKIKQGAQVASEEFPAPLPTMDRVQEVVARRWGVTAEGLRSKSRTKSLTVPRQVAMYLARDMLGMQLVEIGNAFGGRDHSTVIHSVGKVETEIRRNRPLREKIEMARRELSAP
ncbi:MAG: chromosomal replication initiator protein DnaA [Gemmatimonadota bacterium]|nr:chromosomal replication initiator protein DnaA [Gemmatimonadota bacterium]